MPARNASIDGLRGLLALYVVLYHVAFDTVVGPYVPSGLLAVDGFFLMSGYVLTIAWNGDFFVLLLRRLLRLWPVYAFALVVGSLLFGVAVSWRDFAFYPMSPSAAVWKIDSPVWSLHVEMWAMLAMPFIVWSGKSLPRTALGFAIFMLAGFFYQRLGYGMFFVIGSYLARYRFNVAAFNCAIPQWLGKISYSLYLTHWIILERCVAVSPRFGAVVAIPLALVVGYLVWAGVERPSIDLSRKVGSILTRARMAIA